MITATAASRHGAGLAAKALVFVVMLFLAALTPLAAQEDPIEGTLNFVPKTAPEEAAPEVPPLRVIALAGQGASGEAPDWQKAYHQAPGEGLSIHAQATLRVARSSELGRSAVVQELKNGGERARPLIRSLDVGRHDLLKSIYARAFQLANIDLANQKKSPLLKVLTVNSGGTGDYTRDQDITAFAGDEVTEKAFFAALIQAATEQGLVVDPKKTGGIDFPQIEVTIFPGGNDLPDSRFATDMGEFQLDYMKGIHKQLGDVEAYIGGGADLEVKGRRRPGQVYAQEFTLGDDGSIRYAAEVPGNSRETRALFDVEPRARPEAWQKAAHIFNDLLQGYRHSLHGEDPSKGPLKYSGRAIDYLCSLRGKKPWRELQPDERKVMLESLFPGQKVPESLLGRMETVIDIADEVVKTKKLPGGARPEIDEKIALIFLKKAVAASAGEMARQAINPPSFELSWLSPDDRARWDALDPAQRHEEALKRDRVYRENFSNEAYENLVVTLAMLRRIDLEEAKRGKAFHGEEAIRQVITSADPTLRPILEDASDYARLYMELQTAPTPDQRERVRGELVPARKTLAGHLEAEAPGKLILDEMANLGPRRYLEADMAGRRAMPALAVEIKERFDEHMRQTFPTTAEEYRAFRADLSSHGMKGYAWKKLQGEAFQLDSIADALSLVEMYQRGAKDNEYGRFIAVNLLSRLHWSFSHLYSASQVKTEADIEALGQNLVFATLCRAVPWAATAKIVFDIGKGAVTVTVGYAINVVNADLVDALYTGEAGRNGEEAAGSVGVRIRDSGFCILPAEHVLRLVDPDTRKEVRAIDRPEVYRHFFRKWTGFEPEDLPEYGNRLGSIARMHDDLVRILERQAENYDRTWVSSAARKRISLRLTGGEVEAALQAFQNALDRPARLAAEAVAAEAGVRSYKSYFDSEDAIVRGLSERFSSDLLMGFLTYWESRLTAQVLAMRELERTALQADCAGYARVIRERVHDSIVGPGPEAGRPPLDIEVHADVYGLRSGEDEPFDAAEPIRVVGYISGEGEVGEHAAEIVIRVSPIATVMVHKAGENPDVIEPGDVIEQTFLVQAVADQGRGAELGQVKVYVPVRMPAKAANSRTVNLRRHIERNRDGDIIDSFTYIERFAGMPLSWPREDGYVFHGSREVLRFGTARETINYRYGQREGRHEIYDGKGRCVIEESYRDGKEDGLRIHRDPDSEARHEIDYRMGLRNEEREYADNGQLIRRITYQPSRGETQEQHSCSGTVQAFWATGKPRFHGAYALEGQLEALIGDRGGYYGEKVPGKQGVWETFYIDGKKRSRETFKDGLLQGTYEFWSEEGKSEVSGSYENHLKEGSWHEGRGRGSYAKDQKVGRWEYCDDKGERMYWEQWSGGRVTESGQYIDED